MSEETLLEIELIHQVDDAKEHIAELQRQNRVMQEALILVACGKRSDGTYNRCRGACEELAIKALKECEKP